MASKEEVRRNHARFHAILEQLLSPRGRTWIHFLDPQKMEVVRTRPTDRKEDAARSLEALIASAAAVDRIARLHVFGERQDVIAPGAAHMVSERRRPALPGTCQTQGMASAVRTLKEIAGMSPLWHGNHISAIGAADVHEHQSPSSRLRRPRSKPTTTSFPTVITGTAMRRDLATSSSCAAVSSATFFAVNAMPWDERNSFAAWQDCQVEDQ